MSLQNLVRSINETFHQNTRPTKILLVEQTETTSEQLADFPSVNEYHRIHFTSVMPNVFVTSYSGNNVATGMAIEAVLGHRNFVLADITHHYLR